MRTRDIRLALALAASCCTGGTETGNPPLTVEVHPEALTIEPDPDAPGSSTIVRGAPGAVTGGAELVLLRAALEAVELVVAGDDGSFEAPIAGAVEEPLRVHATLGADVEVADLAGPPGGGTAEQRTNPLGCVEPDVAIFDWGSLAAGEPGTAILGLTNRCDAPVHVDSGRFLDALDPATVQLSVTGTPFLLQVGDAAELGVEVESDAAGAHEGALVVALGRGSGDVSIVARVAFE